MVKPDTKRITKDIPTNYEQEYDVVMSLLKEDRAYVDDSANAKVLDSYDMAEIFKKLSNHLERLNSSRLNIRPLSLDSTPIISTAGPLSSPNGPASKAIKETVKAFQKYLSQLQSYLSSKKVTVDAYHKHENFLLQHNYRNGKNYNKEVGVYIDNVVE